MRRLVLAATILGAACSAQAADLSDFLSSSLRGSYADGYGAPKINWQGYYAGGQAAYSSITAKPQSTINSDLTSTFLAPPGIAYNWQGLGTASGSGAGFGAFAGYNSQWDDVVIGIEANYMHTGLSAVTTGTGYTVNPNLTIASTTHSTAAIQPTDFGTARLRAGYVIDSYLPYLFAGVGVGSQTVERNASATPSPQYSPFFMDSNTKTKLVYGYSAGLGVDVMLVKGLFVRAEYEFQRISSIIGTNINSARIGVGYKF